MLVRGRVPALPLSGAKKISGTRDAAGATFPAIFRPTYVEHRKPPRTGFFVYHFRHAGYRICVNNRWRRQMGHLLSTCTRLFFQFVPSGASDIALVNRPAPGEKRSKKAADESSLLPIKYRYCSFFLLNTNGRTAGFLHLLDLKCCDCHRS